MQLDDVHTHNRLYRKEAKMTDEETLRMRS